MLVKSILTLSILIIIISPSHQLQNLCGTDPTITHVADPSSCHLYIECERIGSSITPRFGSCYGTGADFVFTDESKNVWCAASDSHCTDPLWSCPPETEHDIMVADPYDRSCRRHRPCRNLSGNFSQCAGSLVFNRNTGLCDYWYNAPCDLVPLPVKCPAGFTGFYPGNSCYQYVYCQDGDILLNLECSWGMYFDQYAESCLYDNYGNCPRSKIESKNVDDFLVRN